MTINAIAFIPPVSMPALASTDAVAQPANFSLMSESSAISEPSGQFANWFSQQLAQVNDQLQLVMQVRNHLLDAYREVLQMQV